MEKETRRSRMIQEGTYGCAFTPALPCRKSKLKGRERSRSVGKIIRLKNAEIELSMATLIQAIPGYERYFIVQEVDDCDAENMKAIRREYGQ